MACLIVTEHAQSHAYDYAAFGRLIVPTMLLEIRSDACVRLRPTAVRTYAVVGTPLIRMHAVTHQNRLLQLCRPNLADKRLAQHSGEKWNMANLSLAQPSRVSAD